MGKTWAVYPWKFDGEKLLSRRRGGRRRRRPYEDSGPCALRSGGPGEQARSPSADGVLSRREGVREEGGVVGVVTADGGRRSEAETETALLGAAIPGHDCWFDWPCLTGAHPGHKTWLWKSFLVTGGFCFLSINTCQPYLTIRQFSLPPTSPTARPDTLRGHGHPPAGHLAIPASFAAS